MDQTTLDDLSASGDGRPDAEAVAVAGETATHVSEVIDAGDVRVPEPTAETTVELMVTAVDYTVEGRGSDEYPVVNVFGRTTDDEREHVRVVGVEPYFYVPTADVADRDLVSEYDVILDTREHPHGDPANERFESIRGEPVTKITTRTPRDVGQIRDEFATTYEADILFPNRFLIDHGVTAGLRVEPRRIDGDDDAAIQVTPEHLEPTDVDADLRVNTFDIEVDDRNGFPENGEEPIVCLTSHDSYRDEYVLWLYDAPDGEGSEVTDDELLDAFDEYEFISGGADVRLERFETEDAMLDAYLSYIDETDPDVTTGWNCLPGDADIQMADGSVEEIKDVEIGDEVVGEEEQSMTTAEVTNKWESNKEVIELQLADGTTLRSSEEHRVMVGDESEISWTEAGGIQAGDYVLKPRKLRVDDPVVPEIRNLVPREYHRFDNQETVSEFKSALPYGAVSELSEEFDVSKQTLYHPNTTVWTPKRCSRAAQQFDISVPDGGVEYRGTGCDLDTDLSTHEAYLAGLVLTDGSMSQDDGIRFYNTKRALHEQFHQDPHLEPDGKGCYKQNVLDFSRMWAFNGLGIPFGDKNASGVDLSTVYEMPERYVAHFLAGVIDGDGSVNDSVTVAAENETIGEWYVRLFKRLGVYVERNDNVVRVPDAERDLGVVRERILPHMSHPEKVPELSDLVGGESGRSENIPYALFEAPEGTDRRRIGRDKHRRGINLKRHETDTAEWEEFVFVEVDSTTVVGTETTYDIETTTHNFVADDCLVHNCDDFDAPYLFDRMEKLDAASDYDLSPDRASRVGETWRSGWGGPDVKGRVVFDLLYAYQRTKFSELDSYRLDAVAELELGVGKERYTGDIGDLWEDDPTRLLEYNLRDVELCVEIDRQQNLIDFWDDTRKFVGCQLEDAPTPGDVVDMYVLHQAFGEFVLPTKGQQAGEEFEGGAVFEPISGVAENVSVLDLKSLYPMCMVTINASPETIVDDPETYDGETYRAPDGTRFRKEPDGMMREMVDALLTEREQKKTRRDEHDPDTEAYEKFDRQQASIKVIMNSLYGVSGWEQFRLYDKDNAAAITAMGRRVIEFTEEAAAEIDYDVTYGDSVTGDRPLVVRDDGGRVRILPAAELFERAELDDSDVVLTADGGPVGSVTLGKDRASIPGWEALSLADDGTAEWQSIEEVVRHEADGEVVNLQHKFGESTTTRDHSYVVEEENEYVERPPEAVTEPLRIPDVPSVDTVDTVDVYEVLNGYTREYVDGRSVGKEHGYEKTKRVHTDGEYVWFGHSSHGDSESTIKVQREIDLTEPEGRSLVRLLAAYITEGGATTTETAESKFGASISESRREWLAGIKTDYERLFENAEVSVIASDTSDERTVTYETQSGKAESTYDDGTKKLQMMNELSAVFFREFAGQTSRGKRIPSFVYHLEDELQQLFIETLIEGDGSREFPRYTEEYAEKHFDFETTSRELAAGLSTLLTQRDRKHSLKYRDEKDSYTIRTCGHYRSGRDPVVEERTHDGYVYDLSVAENENFVDAIGGIVLHNTDSVMLSLSDISTADTDVPGAVREAHPEMSTAELQTTQAAIEASEEIETYINGRYDEFASEELGAEEHRFEIEFEKLYRRFFQAGKKKRYAGHIVWKEGKDVDDIDITGFEYTRSDIAPITKRVQQRVIEMIVTGEPLDDVKEFLHEEIQAFTAGEVDVDEIGIPGGIGKKLDNYDTDTAQVRGAKYANLLLGTNFQSGSKPKRLYLEKVHPDFFQRVESETELTPNGPREADALYTEFKRDPDVICYEFADELPAAFEIDYEKMLAKTLKGPISRITDSLGLSWDEIESGQEQTGLGQWG